MTTSAPVRLVHHTEVLERVGVHRITLRKMVKRGRFPAPVRLGYRTIAWRSCDVDAWFSSLVPDAAGMRNKEKNPVKMTGFFCRRRRTRRDLESVPRPS